MSLSKEKKEALCKKMATLGIQEEDLVEKFILGSGKGGQNINKTASCVYLRHVPTGLEVKCQQERSRELNRYLARKMLCELFLEHLGLPTQKSIEEEKKRKRKKDKARKLKKKQLSKNDEIS
jgi:protein subunit release factor B